MKKTLLLTALFAILFTCTFVALPLNFALGEELYASTALSNDICAFIKDESVLQITDDFVVIGNNSNINEKQFRELALSGSAKVYLHYSTKSNVPLQYDACLIINNLGKSLEYEYSEQISISTNKLLSNIKKFVARYVDQISMTSYAATPSAVNSNDIPTTFTSTIIDREYVANFDDAGYITYHIGVTRYIANSKSILYIVTVNNSFVPGIVANQNGDTSYKKFKNLDGYVHMTVEQAYDRNEEYYYGIRYGTVPYKKDYWPINQPLTVTITSSVQLGLTLGYSFSNGFSTSGDVNMNVGVNLGSNISYGYSKALTQNDPFFSAQVSANNLNECQWNYTCNSSQDRTCHLQTNYMFEMANERKDMFIGDFRLKLDYSFHLQRSVLFIPINKTYTHSADLFVQAGEYQSIRNFNNGII